MSRDRRLIAVFAALAVLAAGGLATGFLLPAPGPASVIREVPSGPDGRVSVQFVGDTLVADEVQTVIDQRGIGYDWPFDAIRPALTADYVVAVGEGPITARTEAWNPAKRYSYHARPETAGALARGGIDAVSLANNHAFDTGPEGLADTIGHLDAAGIASVGAGPDLARAEQPLLLRTARGTVGVVAIGKSFGHRAGEDRPGTLVMTPESIHRGAALAREAGADWVIGFPHWGRNYQPIDREQRASAQVFADAGYDMVIGSGPHSVQPIEYVGTMPVVYSVGNFVFGTPGRWPTYRVPGFGLSVEVEFGGTATPVSVRCHLTDNMIVNFQPRPCSPDEARGFLPTLNPALAVQGDVGALPCATCPGRPSPPAIEGQEGTPG